MRPLTHGGDLAWAAREFGEPAQGWQDLSTGISPWSYPVGELPAHIWQRLPEADVPLRRSAASYYRVPETQLLPVPGSQFAIGRLPFYLPPARVALPGLGYAEHAQAWSRAGHRLFYYRDGAELSALVEGAGVEHLVVINPNNPSTEALTPEWLLALYRHHRQRGLLLIDEAFADVRPELSVAAHVESNPDLWVLRSVGKFFGLAGLRLGFLVGHSERYPIRLSLEAELSPWGVSHPAQWLGAQALQNRAWQAQQRCRIEQGSEALRVQWRDFVNGHGGDHRSLRVDNAGLFITLRGPWQLLARWYRQLGERGILLRWCHWPEPEEGIAQSNRAWLRCGLPQDSGQRLQAAFKSILDHHHNG